MFGPNLTEPLCIQRDVEYGQKQNDPPQESLAVGKGFHLSDYIAFWAILSIIC